jgi:hypothetical protein
VILTTNRGREWVKLLGTEGRCVSFYVQQGYVGDKG